MVLGVEPRPLYMLGSVSLASSAPALSQEVLETALLKPLGLAA